MVMSFFFFVKQKTAYEMRISDWSSDVCSSDLVVGEHRAGCVGEGESLAVVRDPVAVRHAHAAGGPVPGEENVVRPVDLRQIGKLAVVGADDGGIELELLRRIGDPTFAEAFPSERRDGALSEHRPPPNIKIGRAS